jgi:hypothetical protein
MRTCYTLWRHGEWSKCKSLMARCCMQGELIALTSWRYLPSCVWYFFFLKKIHLQMNSHVFIVN